MLELLTFGDGDVDAIYGDLSRFATEEVLDCRSFTTGADRLSGHFALFRNCEETISAFRRIVDIDLLYPLLKDMSFPAIPDDGSGLMSHVSGP
ncbi:DUF6625 family protein [Haloferula sp. BvORR071]|uniref:DUF6625 family protein n=1 Tax=Haloferula sp. BvORR071 TaxID=1396141 RepID=UPI002240EAA2|nr:DUF6625 family protein [Haloferula sp. BvORR071]